MTTLTKQYIDDHCVNLGISRDQLTEFVVPDGITEIKRFAFSECTSLQSIYIPKGVTKIGVHAFENCTSLESIYSPDGVTEIGEQAFLGCSSILPASRGGSPLCSFCGRQACLPMKRCLQLCQWRTAVVP